MADASQRRSAPCAQTQEGVIVRFRMAKSTSLELRLLKEQEAKLSALRAALVEGENSGASAAFDFDHFIARKRKSGSSAA